MSGSKGLNAAASNLTFSFLSLIHYIMVPLPSKHAFVTLLVAAAAIHGFPLPPLHTEPVVDRGLSDSIGNLIDKAKSGVEGAIDGVGRLVGIGNDDSNRTPPLLVAKDVFSELTKGALYSNAAYCGADSVRNLSCGATCEALGNIKVAFTGGDNREVPACKWKFRLFNNYCYSYFLKPVFIAFDPSIQSVVVATQGTEPTELPSLLTDAQFLQDPLDLTNFPSAPPTAKVHQGFQKAFE